MTNPLCPRCGRPLAPDAPGGLCAACLLAASETVDSGSTDSMATTPSSDASTANGAATTMEPGVVWGPYRLGRLLGRGGMGEVYEAEHLPSGRRLALKVLRNRLQTRAERARFLREGQLAASVSHPHTVYIFGSEEVDGTPVISMELLAGGTLKDRVAAGGPMPPVEAVAAIMDVIGGLDAAAAAGILHRDIKPSNCFVDRNGVVKVGDFGLSISTLARDVHQQLVTSGFEGTPQFAPPEQLRGEPLDVRADIYAVGATLYYLLTGNAPFDAADLRDLFAKVTSDAPVPPHQQRRDVPARLSAVVMRCLTKNPAGRPSSYPALADALRPFLAGHDRPAPLATRTLAGLVDAWVVVGIPVTLLTTVLADPLSGSPARTAAVANLSWAAALLYYLVLEGATGASLGKQLLGLRVATAAGSPPRWAQIAARVLLFYAPNILIAATLGSPWFIDSESGQSSSGFYINWKQTGPPVLAFVMFFATARRGNGWTGLHDVLSRTRVVARPSAIARHPRIAQQAAAATIAAGPARSYGPFIALDASDPRPGTVVRAFDPVLRRQVWIEIAGASTPPIDGARRDVSRPARLHWLAGRRSPGENWDAYEAPGGAAWAAGAAERPWSQVKHQLLDLVNELADSAEDGTRPGLALDRVWMRDNGRVVLLDFPPPYADPHAPADLTPEQLLQAAAARVPRYPSQPDALPLSARAFLERWSGRALPGVAGARAALVAMTATPNDVHWWRRAVPGTLAAAPVACALLVAVTLLPALARNAPAFGGMIISTATASALALVLLLCVVSSLLVPGGLVSRQVGLATVTRSGREITRVHSLARTLTAGLPALVWLTYLAFAPMAQGFVETSANPVAGTLVTVGVLALGLIWTIVRRTRGPHDLLTGTWVVPR